ncbi:MAG: hypothetical protein ABSA50_09870 [Candidatus Bathyarchaeia archaeon]|jgi:hypothetical protein
MKSTSQDRRTLIAVFIILLIVCELMVYVGTTPRPSEQFFQIYILGANHTATRYYPRNDPDLGIDEPVTWYLGVTDNMGTVQLVSLRIKISNMTIKPPDDKGLESPAPTVTDFAKFLQNNETWEMPFVWSISNATLAGGSTRILNLEINNETYQISDWMATNGYNFRLIIELWTWQTDSNAWGFGWNSDGENRTAWLQVWFNMTNAEPKPVTQ